MSATKRTKKQPRRMTEAKETVLNEKAAVIGQKLIGEIDARRAK